MTRVDTTYWMLRWTYGLVPVVAGLDKFTNLLADWTQYVAPIFPGMLGISKQTFMYGVGAIEIVAGILVALKPRYAAYVVAGWLAGIILNLLLLGQYLDVALRDFGLFLAALALARLAQAHDRQARAEERPVAVSGGVAIGARASA